mmetsp:Transcript_18045/g.37562  ORF Transcript_18045/g.37562 Transcript_18045/m.37562 type:complete len:851 (+) Transcript_18045:320-2872(+)
MASTGGKRPHQLSFLDEDVEEFKVFVRDVQDNLGHKRAFYVKPWTTIKDIKDRLSSLLSIPPASQRLFYGPSQPLKNNRTLNDVGVYKTGATLLLDIVGRPVPHQSSTPTNSAASSTSNSPRASREGHFFNTSRTIHFPPNPDGCSISVTPSLLPLTSRSLLKTITQADRAFSLNLKPLATLDGSGGTYILRNPAKHNVAVFKPSDEEPYATNNPRGFLPSADITMRTGHVPGTGCYREVAAYLLDHSGLACVPETTLAEASHRSFNFGGKYDTLASGGGGKGIHSIVTATNPATSATAATIPMKLGSFQAFVQSDCTMDDISPSVIPTYEVQKIALLDIRIMNADRNAANLLARRRRTSDGTSWTLVPIDHGYCLRNKADVAWCDWCWLEWPQIKKPLSKKLKQYVLNLDIEKDVSILKDRLNIDDATCDVFRAANALLVKGVRAGMSLYEIANMCCRTDDLGEVPSTLEKILVNAADLSYHAVDNEKFSHRVASKAIMSRLSLNHPTNPPPPPISITSTRSTPKSISKNLNHLPSVLSTSSDSDSSDELSKNEKEERELTSAPVDVDTSPPSEPPDSSKSDSPTLWAEEILHQQQELQPKLTIDVPSPPSRKRSASTASTDSDMSRSPGGFWVKRPSSPVKAPMCGSFNESDVPSFSLESPVRTTGKGVLQDIFMLHSNAKLRSSLSAQDLSDLAIVDDSMELGTLTRTCSLEGAERIEDVGIGKRARKSSLSNEYDSDSEEKLVGAAKALTFTDFDSGFYNVIPPKLVKSKSYSALNNAATSNPGRSMGVGGEAYGGGHGRGGSVHVPSTQTGFSTPALGPAKENLVRSYFHRFVDLLLINELEKRK